jgi:hypothetical protein
LISGSSFLHTEQVFRKSEVSIWTDFCAQMAQRLQLRLSVELNFPYEVIGLLQERQDRIRLPWETLGTFSKISDAIRI